MSKMIDVETLAGGGRFKAYIAEPEATPNAAIIVIQEIFGINPGIRAKCDRLAEAGYLAVAPDLFWRMEPGVELDPDIPEQLQQAFGYIQKVDVNLAVQDIEATIRVARKRIDGGKVGVVGYCFGGRLAFLAATRTDADASIGYYGGGIDTMLGEGHAIARPLMLHFAGEDGHITPEKVARIKDALAGNAHVTIHEYPGADHGFATESGKRRQPQAADQADGRSAAFFAANLA